MVGAIALFIVGRGVGLGTAAAAVAGPVVLGRAPRVRLGHGGLIGGLEGCRGCIGIALAFGRE